jgi:hypothetical protein
MSVVIHVTEYELLRSTIQDAVDVATEREEDAKVNDPAQHQNLQNLKNSLLTLQTEVERGYLFR